MATVEETTTTTDDKLLRPLANSKGSHSTTSIVNDTNEDHDTDEDKELPANVDDDAETQQASNSGESTSEDGNADDEIERRRKELVKANLFGRRKYTPRSKDQSKDTSVGVRRIGSATKARQSVSAPSRVMDSLWKTAAAKSKDKPEISPKKDQSDASNMLSYFPNSVRPLTRSAIMNAVEEALSDSKPKVVETSLLPMSNLTAAHFTHEYERPMGLLADSNEIDSQSATSDVPGDIVAHPSSNDSLLVRIATPSDDLQIATLRLSVFSDFTPEQQGKFCERSCQAISSRRLRGACCLIAAQEDDAEIVLGTAECSYHEFFGTRLGERRPQFSILYVTEVAVDAHVRGQGVGKKLMTAVDFYAKARGVETIYLHVDVENQAALALYKKSGYERVNGEEDSMYLEFTTSLHLHPGATKGRDHYLLFKNLVSEPVWFEPKESRVDQRVETRGKLGFEVSL